MIRCKAPEILRNEAYFAVRRNDEGLGETPQMAVFQQPANTWGGKAMNQRTKARKRLLSLRNESGATAVVVGLLSVVFLGFAAMAVDFSHLMVVRNELQNAADAAALAGASAFYPSTTPPTPNWIAAETSASNAIRLNKSDGVNLVNCEVGSGYWNLSQTPFGLQPQSITPGDKDAPAVKVRVSRSAGMNAGPVVPFFARILGIDSVSASAEAVAVVASPGSVAPGALFPVAISKAVADQAGDYNDDTKTIKIGSSYHYPDSQAGQWTSLDLDRNDVSTIRDLIENGNPTPLKIGDNIWIQPGTETTLYSSVPVGKEVCLLVVDAILSDTTHSEVPIYAFIGFHIIGSVGQNEKYIEGHFIPDFYFRPGGPIGPNYGAYTPPRLVY